MTRLKYSLALALVFLLRNMAAAQADSTTETKPIQISGNADVYFRLAQNKTASSTIPSYAHGRPGLGWLNLMIEGDFKRWGFGTELGAGERATQLYSAEGEEFSFIVQSFAFYKINDRLKASAGTFTTHFNYEYTEPGSNGNYSNTYIYTVIPASYLGLRLDYALNDQWSFMLGLYGDSDRRQLKGNGRHVAALANYAGDKLNVAFNFIEGRDGDSTQVLMADCYGDYAFTERFKLGWELHFMLDNNDDLGKSYWQGLAIYAQQQLAPRFSLNLRSEWFDDVDGYWFGLPKLHVFSNTLTGKFTLHPVVLMPEIRLDRSNDAVFARKNGTNSKQELSFLMGASVFF